MYRQLFFALCAISMVAGASASHLQLVEEGDNSFKHLVSEHRQKLNRTSSHNKRTLLSSCSSHSGCDTGEYCYDDSYYGGYGGYCGPCQWCYWDNDSITGSCPSQCSYAASCAAVLPFANGDDYDYDYTDIGDLNQYYGSCGGLGKKSNQWCATRGPSFPATCHAYSESDCCEPNTGAIAGIVVGIVVFIALIIALSAWCCKCCCFRPKLVVLGQQHAVQMVQQVPQVVVVPSVQQ